MVDRRLKNRIEKENHASNLLTEWCWSVGIRAALFVNVPAVGSVQHAIQGGVLSATRPSFAPKPVLWQEASNPGFGVGGRAVPTRVG